MHIHQNSDTAFSELISILRVQQQGIFAFKVDSSVCHFYVDVCIFTSGGGCRTVSYSLCTVWMMLPDLETQDVVSAATKIRFRPRPVHLEVPVFLRNDTEVQYRLQERKL